MNIKIISEVDKVILHLYGKIDISGSETLKGALNQILDEGSIRNLFINFAKVSYIGSSGIGRLLQFFSRFSLRGGVLWITNLNEDLTEIFCSFKLHQLFRIIDDK
jgi:anti-anti-sigma factor